MLVDLTFVRGDVLRTLPPAQQETALRLNILSMVQAAGSGHLGSSLSVLGILLELRKDRRPDDIVFSSKGHDVPAFYALQHLDGLLSDDDLLTLRRPNGLPGHPERGVAGQLVSTGSLGMGLSKAVGLAYAYPDRRVRVIVGDGELQEGQCWEALSHVGRLSLDNLQIHVDANGYQSDLKTLDIEAKADVLAHDYIYVHRTQKGAGVLERNCQRYPFHSGALDPTLYKQCVSELVAQLPDIDRLDFTVVPRPYTAKAPSPFVAAYTKALHALLPEHPNAVLLDADLAWDCGLADLTLCGKVIECGIAEQHMVSMASGLAAVGKQPICHTFAAFYGRAHEQIRDVLRDTHTAVLFVGALAGTRPIGPGRSHDVGDLDLLSFQQGPCVVLDPQTPEDVAPMLARALRHDGSVYLRLR